MVSTIKFCMRSSRAQRTAQAAPYTNISYSLNLNIACNYDTGPQIQELDLCEHNIRHSISSNINLEASNACSDTIIQREHKYARESITYIRKNKLKCNKASTLDMVTAYC